MTTSAEWIEHIARLCEEKAEPPTTKRWIAFLLLDDGTVMPLGRIKGGPHDALFEAMGRALSRVVLQPDEEDET